MIGLIGHDEVGEVHRGEGEREGGGFLDLLPLDGTLHLALLHPKWGPGFAQLGQEGLLGLHHPHPHHQGVDGRQGLAELKQGWTFCQYCLIARTFCSCLFLVRILEDVVILIQTLKDIVILILILEDVVINCLLLISTLWPRWHTTRQYV